MGHVLEVLMQCRRRGVSHFQLPPEGVLQPNDRCILAPSLPVSCKRCASKALLEPIQQHKPAGTGLDACQSSCLLLRSVHGTHAAAVLQAEQLGYERVPGVLPTPGGGRTVQAVAGSLPPAEGALLQPRVRLAVHV